MHTSPSKTPAIKRMALAVALACGLPAYAAVITAPQLPVPPSDSPVVGAYYGGNSGVYVTGLVAAGSLNMTGGGYTSSGGMIGMTAQVSGCGSSASIMVACPRNTVLMAAPNGYRFSNGFWLNGTYGSFPLTLCVASDTFDSATDGAVAGAWRAAASLSGGGCGGGGNGDTPSCFPAGARVLMADGSERAIETIRTGDWVLGADGFPVRIEAVDRPLLGERRMMVLPGTDHVWSEEHAHWTDLAGEQWFWAANPERWRWEVSIGHTGGLLDNGSMRGGEVDGFAWLDGEDGWYRGQAVEAVGFGPDTQLYLPRTNGVAIIVDGFVVGAGVNERAYDYSAFDWTIARQAVLASIDDARRQAA